MEDLINARSREIEQGKIQLGGIVTGGASTKPSSTWGVFIKRYAKVKGKSLTELLYDRAALIRAIAVFDSLTTTEKALFKQQRVKPAKTSQTAKTSQISKKKGGCQGPPFVAPPTQLEPGEMNIMPALDRALLVGGKTKSAAKSKAGKESAKKNDWISFVKCYAKAHNMTYPVAIADPAVSKAYKKHMEALKC